MSSYTRIINIKIRYKGTPEKNARQINNNNKKIEAVYCDGFYAFIIFDFYEHGGMGNERNPPHPVIAGLTRNRPQPAHTLVTAQTLTGF
jgi:hypothetical protein